MLVACSDDGLAPPADTDQGTTAASGIASADGSGGEPTSTDAQGTTSAEPPGGSSTGESGPVSDSSGGGTTGEPPVATCEMPEQCVLVDDCCQCAAVHVDEPIPECEIDCKVTQCTTLGIPDIGVVCDAGTCGLEPRDCSGIVACDSLPPQCPEGTLPEVGPDGGCWTGACIPVEACDPVPGCEHCGTDEVCVQTVTQLGATSSCRALPEECGGTPTCDCMPPDTCESPFDACMAVDDGIECSCPVC